MAIAHWTGYSLGKFPMRLTNDLLKIAGMHWMRVALDLSLWLTLGKPIPSNGYPLADDVDTIIIRYIDTGIKTNLKSCPCAAIYYTRAYLAYLMSSNLMICFLNARYEHTI